jgi:hypothetical protein
LLIFGIRVSFDAAEIQTPIAPIVHPKINSGKEFPQTRIQKPEVRGQNQNKRLLPPSSDFRLRKASCDEPARQVAHAEFGMRILFHKAQALSRHH